MITKRSKCVICLNKDLLSTKIYDSFPTHTVMDLPVYDNTSFHELNIGFCEYCKSIQLITLLDQNILYSNYHYDNSQNILWNEHYNEFASFIISNITDTSKEIIEIGAHSLILAEKLISSFNNYTILDICIKNIPKNTNIKYIEANCEHYNYSKNNILIMSHVFEHLYNPAIFIENCKKNNVEHILISIPNMNSNEFYILKQHTFIYNDNDIEYLFNKYNYKLINKYFFKNDHSIFFNFKLDNTLCNTIERVILSDRHKNTVNFFNTTFNIPPNSFLTLVGFRSQIVYLNTSTKENIIGILDSIPSKHNKYFYGTNILISPFTILEKYNTPVNVIIKNNIYTTSELIDKVKKINSKVNIILI